MSVPRKSHRPPPDSAEHVVGGLLEFTPADDLANPGGATTQLQPVELTPVGTPAARVDLLPTDDKIGHPESRESGERPNAPS